MGRHVIALLLLLGVANVEAGGEESSERSMLFNTRGLAVSTAAAAAAGAAFFFAQAALSKLAFIAQAIEEKGIDFGALVELICDRTSKPAYWSSGSEAEASAWWWPRAKGATRRGRRATRSRSSIRLRKYKPVKGTGRR